MQGPPALFQIHPSSCWCTIVSSTNLTAWSTVPGMMSRTARPASADSTASRDKEDVHERLYTLALLQAAKAEQRRRDK